MARTAKQKAALRKAQLASARKRKGKGNPKLKAAHAKARRRMGMVGRIGLAAVGVSAGYYGAVAYGNYKNRNNYKAPKRAAPVRIARIRIRTVPKTTATRASTSSSTFDSRYNAAVAFRNSQVKEAKRKRTNARYARVSQKVAARGMYNSGLNSNVGGRTFVAGRGGTYRR